MALVPVTVLDTTGHNVLGLDRENFRVFDGAEPRPIVTFGQSDAPVSVGLIFDSSRSMRDKFRIARQAPAELYKQLNPDDESFLITVAENAALKQDFTSEFGAIRMPSSPTRTARRLCSTAFTGLQHLKKSKNPRRALVGLRCGDNNAATPSRNRPDGRIHTQIFAIPSTSPRPPRRSTVPCC
jgi:VWFA-related protein